MIAFILNDKIINTDKPSGMTVLDFVRYEQQLTGTKIGCREGDCGACTILIGEVIGGQMKYKSMTSCITPLINVIGKHVVTIEGLNMKALSPVQEAMVACGGTQCGFCTVGFVVSLYGYSMERSKPNFDAGISAIDGNICRCTGYKSIERATATITKRLEKKDINEPINWLVEEQFLPSYFSTIPERLSVLKNNGKPINGEDAKIPVVGGGTDLYVQRPELLISDHVEGYYDRKELKTIEVKKSICTVGGAVTVTDLLKSESFNALFPKLKKHLKLVSSTPIRNMGTVAGNFVNASPIGDMTIFFLALDSTLVLTDSDSKERKVRLRDFYKGYKTLDLRKNEVVNRLEFEIPDENSYFNFEKVSKRTYLDIASVNTAITIKMQDDKIESIHASAGGVGPIPTYLAKTCAFLKDKALTWENIQSASEILQEDISPISDVRGSKEYKSLLLRQLFTAHFMTLFPSKFEMEELI
jgi:xanthine dehydrogenase small subunit